MFKKKLVRHGECVSCGECCQKIRISAYLKHSLNQHRTLDELVKYYSYRGITVTEVNEKENYINYEVPIPCNQLTADNKCKAHETGEKPFICERYPWYDDNIESCGYSFVKE